MAGFGGQPYAGGGATRGITMAASSNNVGAVNLATERWASFMMKKGQGSNVSSASE
jgi:hypothetical protein